MYAPKEVNATDAVRPYTPSMRTLSGIAAATVAAAALTFAAPAGAAPQSGCGKVSDAQVAQMAMGETRWQVEHMTAACAGRVWSHDGRLQKWYTATDGRSLRVNYNQQPDGRWSLTNAFWPTDNGPVVVVG